MDNTVRRTPPLIVSVRGTALRSPPALLALALLTFVPGGCEPAPISDSDTAIRSDSAGIQLIEYPGLPPIEASRIAIAAEPDLVLGDGRAFAGTEYEFFGIRGISQLSDGTLIVANSGSRELRFYRADGHFLHSAGGEGDGPGEFRYLGHVWIMAGDSVIVWDRAARRLQNFDPDGALVRSTPIDATPFTEFAGGGVEPQAVLEDGRVVVVIDSPRLPTTEVPVRRPLLVALHRIDKGGWDSVRVVPGREDVFIPTGDRTAVLAYQFGAYARAAGAGATMAVADVARFRVELFNPDGRLVSILSASVPEIPVTADVIEAQIELDVDWFGSHIDTERRRTNYSAHHRPFLPAVRDIFIDADERIWVERYDVPARGPSRWEVFERDGTWIGRVEMPEGLLRSNHAWTDPYFSVASGRLAGVWRDPDTGVETVRVYRVIEPDS